jgi:hypothetical protein
MYLDMVRGVGRDFDPSLENVVKCVADVSGYTMFRATVRRCTWMRSRVHLAEAGGLSVPSV